MYCYYPVFIRQDNRIYPFLDSVYASIKLYSGTTESGMAVGGLLQLARFLALATTLSILVNVFNKLNDVINGIKLCSLNATVVYGDSDYICTIKRLLAQGVPVESVAELAHIRWCRYHYIT